MALHAYVRAEGFVLAFCVGNYGFVLTCLTSVREHGRRPMVHWSARAALVCLSQAGKDFAMCYDTRLCPQIPQCMLFIRIRSLIFGPWCDVVPNLVIPLHSEVVKKGPETPEHLRGYL